MFDLSDEAVENDVVARSEGSCAALKTLDTHFSFGGAASLHSQTLLNIVLYHRRRWDMIRARQRLELQAQAICREFTAGDKDAAGKLWRKVRKGSDDVPLPLLAWAEPFLAAILHFEATQAAVERVLAKNAKGMPGSAWASAVRGVSDVSYAAVLAELSGGEDKLFTPADYRSPAAIWKRMGVGLVNAGTITVRDPKEPTTTRTVTIHTHGRQRRISGDEALVHGYVAQRRSILWNIGKSIIMQQMRQGEAIGPYGELYVHRRELERTKVASKAHAHARAQRYVEKRFLTDLWREWRNSQYP